MYYKNMTWVWGTDRQICPKGHCFGITRLCRVMPKQWHEGLVCRSVPHTNDRFFFLHTFFVQTLELITFYLKRRRTFTPAILYFDVIFWRSCDVRQRPSYVTSITTSVKHRVNTPGSEHQGQTNISDPDQKFGFTCIFFRHERSSYIHVIFFWQWRCPEICFHFLETGTSAF